MFFSRGFFEDKGSIYGDDYYKIYSVDRDYSGSGLLTRCKVGDIDVLVSGHEYSYVNFLLGEGLNYLNENRAELLSLGLDFVPVVGNLKVLLESVYGRDFLTGRDLGRFERGMGLGLVLLPQAKNAGKLGKKFLPVPILKGAGKVGEKVGKYAIRPAKLAAGWIKEKTYRGARRISGGFWGMFGYEATKASGKVLSGAEVIIKDCLAYKGKDLFFKEGGSWKKIGSRIKNKNKLVFSVKGTRKDAKNFFYKLVDKFSARSMVGPMERNTYPESRLARLIDEGLDFTYRPVSSSFPKPPTVGIYAKNKFNVEVKFF